MSKQFEEMRDYVQLIRQESAWGHKQSLYTYSTYVRQELAELDLAIKLRDYANICEELADVCMMLEFYRQELYALGVCALSFPKATLPLLTKNSFGRLEGCEKKALVPWREVKKRIDITAYDNGLSLEKLYGIVCSKLELRYPDLLPYQQLTLDNECQGEEIYWNSQKRYYKMMEFCTCLNAKCANYHKAFNGSNFMVVRGTSKRGTYIICKKCYRRIPVTQAVLFYGYNYDYKVALRAIVEYMYTKNQEKVCKDYHIRPNTLLKLVQKCEDNYEFFQDILLNRYQTGEFRTVKNFEER